MNFFSNSSWLRCWVEACEFAVGAGLFQLGSLRRGIERDEQRALGDGNAIAEADRRDAARRFRAQRHRLIGTQRADGRGVSARRTVVTFVTSTAVGKAGGPPAGGGGCAGHRRRGGTGRCRLAL